MNRRGICALLLCGALVLPGCGKTDNPYRVDTVVRIPVNSAETQAETEIRAGEPETSGETEAVSSVVKDPAPGSSNVTRPSSNHPSGHEGTSESTGETEESKPIKEETEPTAETAAAVSTEPFVTEIPAETAAEEKPVQPNPTEMPAELPATEAPTEPLVTEMVTEPAATEPVAVIAATEQATEPPAGEFQTEPPTEPPATVSATEPAPTEPRGETIPTESPSTETQPEETSTQPPAETAEPTEVPYNPQNYSVGSLEKSILKELNVCRAEAGLDELSISKWLSGIAALRAWEAAALWDHTRPDGRNYATAMTDYGYAYSISSENLAYAAGSGNAAAIVGKWMNTAGRENILNNNFTTAGIGIYSEGGVTYIVSLLVG